MCLLYDTAVVCVLVDSYLRYGYMGTSLIYYKQTLLNKKKQFTRKKWQWTPMWAATNVNLLGFYELLVNFQKTKKNVTHGVSILHVLVVKNGMAPTGCWENRENTEIRYGNREQDLGGMLYNVLF